MRFTALALVVILTAPAYAQEADPEVDVDAYEKGTVGVGIMIGEPTGLCGRLYLKRDQAVQGGVGFGFLSSALQVHADYAFHPFVLQKRDSFVLATYIGPGVLAARYSDGDRGDGHFALGLRAVGGLLFDFNNPLDAFVEVAGVIEYEFAEDIGFELWINAAAGIRYYF
jgi:hypothetical protein